MSVELTADWCATDGNFSISGTKMKESSRKSEGIKWCFVCRSRNEFEFIISVPDGLSWYGASSKVECVKCKTQDGDIFPGWSRQWVDDEEAMK